MKATSMSDELIDLQFPQALLEKIDRDVKAAEERWKAMTPEQKREYIRELNEASPVQDDD